MTGFKAHLMDVRGVPPREGRFGTRSRLNEFDDLDSRYDGDEESRVGTESPDVHSPVAPPQAAIFPTNGRMHNPQHMEFLETKRGDGR